MQSRISNLKRLTGFCILIVAMLLPNICLAQDEAASQAYIFSFLQVKPGMALEFEEFMKSVLPALPEMGITQLDVWRISNFGVSDKYVLIMPAPTPEAMDAELAADETSIPVPIVPVLSALNRLLVSSRDVMIIPQSELTIDTAEGYEGKLALNLSIGTAPGRNAEFEAGLKQILDIMRETGVKGVYTSRVGYGGNLNEYNMSIFFDSFTDLAATMPKFEQKMAEAQLAPPTGIVFYTESEVYVHVPELGIQPEAQ